METRGVLLTTLQHALSQNASVLRPAEEQLKNWETQPGFYSALAGIFTDRTIDVNIRWLAVLCFKNGVDRYWRKNAPNGISEEEKASLREQLTSSFDEPVLQVATQLAVLISKVARLDCPRNWDTLIPRLLSAIQTGDPLAQQRGLLTLHHVTKALASKRLATDRRLFEDLTSNIFGFILQLWNTLMEVFQQAMQNQQVEQTTGFLNHAILCLKVLRRLVVFGFKNPADNVDVLNFITLIFERMDILLKAKHQLQCLAMSLLAKREKYLIVLTKVLLDFQENHAIVFGQFISKALQMTTRYAFMEEGADLLFERFTVNILNVMRFIVRCEKYATPKEGKEKPELREGVFRKSDFFTTPTLCEICRRLVLNYFPLSREDLELWDTDPEDFVGEEGGDSWKYSLRPCTENLFLCLVKDFRSSLVPCVVDLIRENQPPVNPDDLTAVLRKDAVYNAAGLASFELYDDVDFDKWLTASLFPELHNKHPNYRILRRRVTCLIGQWCGVKMSPSLRPSLYQTLLPLLGEEEDLVVRIEAALTLKSIVDEFDFNVDEFLQYLEPFFGSLFGLLKFVSECETKMQILHVMSFIIERMREKVRPYSGALISYLPAIWEESADHNMLRCAILTTTYNLVVGLGTLSVNMYSFLLPVVQISTDVTQECHIYLYEDALDLWHITLLNAPTITDGLLRLFSNMPALFELGGEMLKVCLKITEAYLTLGPHEFLQIYSDTLTKALMSLLTDLRNEGVVMVYKVVDLGLRVAPPTATVFSAMFPTIVNDIINEHEYPMVVSIKMLVIARIIVKNMELFLTLIDAVAQQYNTTSEETLGQLLECMFNKIDNLIYPERKKLVCLAFCALWSSGRSVVLEKFSGMLNICVETLHDIVITEDDEPSDPELIGQEKNLLCTSSEEVEDLAEDEQSEHDHRTKRLNLQDPVFTHPLKESVFSQLALLKQQLGDIVFQQLMESCDSEVVQQLQAFSST